MLKQVIKPARLKIGNTVGIVAPSSPPFEEGQLQYSLRWLDRLGLKPKLGKHLFDRDGDFAGTDETRLSELHEFWADEQISAVMAVRGGNGAVRLLPNLDFSVIEMHPKVFIGFSDITALLIAIHQKTGLVTFHGPTFGSFFESEYTHHFFSKALLDSSPIGEISDPHDLDDFGPSYPPARLVISAGSARGQLIGGNLTVIKQMMGTPFEIDTRDKILFLEEVGEEPHTVDRMLGQLLLGGKLQQAKAIIFGESVDCRPGDSQRSRATMNYSVERILRLRLSSLGIPVIYGMRFGHGKQKFTLPLGVMAHLQAENQGDVRLSIDEAATV